MKRTPPITTLAACNAPGDDEFPIGEAGARGPTDLMADGFRWPLFPVVYFVQAIDGGMVKIGRSANLEKRFEALQSSCPLPLRVIGYVRGNQPEERRWHRRFRRLRGHGEWFAPTVTLLRAIPHNGFCANMLYGSWTKRRRVSSNDKTRVGWAKLEPWSLDGRPVRSREFWRSLYP